MPGCPVVVDVHALTAEGIGSILGWGTKIPQARLHGQKKRKEKYPFISGLRQFKLPLFKVNYSCNFGMPVGEGKLRSFLLHHLNPNP